MIGPLASLIVKTASGPKKPAKSATTFVSNKGDSPSPAMSAKKPTVKKTVVSSEKLLNLKPLERRQQQLSKEKSNTGTPLDSSFNTINESLTNILSIISNTNTFKKEKVKDNQRVEKKQRALHTTTTCAQITGNSRLMLILEKPTTKSAEYHLYLP